MDRGIVGAIYFKLNTAFLRNERTKADAFLGMLEDETKGKDVEKMLGFVHHERFRAIKKAMEEGNYGRLYGFGAETPDEELSFSPSTEPEAQFHLRLLADRQKMFSLLGIDPKATVIHEFAMDPYGRCDYVVKNGRTWHMIEVKMGNAPTSVVSQIDKYLVACELQMCWGLHDSVFGAVVAEGFPTYVAAELSRMSVRMLLHRGDPSDLRLVG